MAVLVRRGAVRYRVVGSGRARHGGPGTVSQGEARSGPSGSGVVRRSWFGWVGQLCCGRAVVATCDKARLGWQGWAVRVRPVAVSQGRAWSGLAVMEGRGLIGVRKSRRSR